MYFDPRPKRKREGLYDREKELEKCWKGSITSRVRIFS